MKNLVVITKKKKEKDEGWFEYCVHHIQEMN
jgi:hypothetical protein